MSAVLGRRTLLAAGAALGAGLNPRSPRAATVLRAACIGTALQSLDPGKATTAPDFWILWAMFNALAKFDANMDIVPDLSESWTTPDPRTWRFMLRRGVRFHDGREMTADDVKFSLDRIRDPAYGSPNRGKLAPVQQVRIIDPYQIEIVTAQPFAPLLTYLTNTRSATQIVSRHAVETLGAAGFAKAPVGTGAFRLAEWRPNEKVVLTAHKAYFGGAPALDVVEIPLINEESTAVNALLGGNVDLIGRAPFDQAQRLEKLPNLTVYRAAGMNTRYMSLNLRRPPFDDVHFRRAVSMAFDRALLVRAVLFNEGRPAQGSIPSTIPWAFDTVPRPICQFNPAAAKAEFAKSKYGPGQAATVLTFGASWWRRWAELFVTQVNQVLGLKLTVEVTDSTTAFQRDKAHEYDALTWGWAGLIEADEYLTECFHTKGWRNTGFYSNPEVDALLDRQRETLDQAERGRLCIAAERLIAEDVPVLFTMQANVHQVYSKAVRGYEGRPYEAFGAQFAATSLGG